MLGLDYKVRSDVEASHLLMLGCRRVNGGADPD